MKLGLTLGTPKEKKKVTGIECPNCKSFKTHNCKAACMGGALLCTVFVFTLPIAPMCLLVGLFTNKKKWNCRDCHNYFEYPEKK